MSSIRVNNTNRVTTNSGMTQLKFFLNRLKCQIKEVGDQDSRGWILGYGRDPGIWEGNRQKKEENKTQGALTLY